MVSGDVTEEYLSRNSLMAQAKIEIVVPKDGKTKSETLSTIMGCTPNGILGFVGFHVPELATAGKTAKLEIYDDEDYLLFETAFLDASVETKYAAPITRYVVTSPLKCVITTDDVVAAARTFFVKIKLGIS